MFFVKKFFLFLILFFLSLTYSFSSEKIAFIDIDYILNNSNLGKIIIIELEEKNKKNIQTLSKKEQNLKKKKEDINKTKNISSKEQLEKDIANFNQEIEKYRSEKDKVLNEFKLLKEKKLDNFLRKINPLIQEYMKTNSIDVLLEKKQIFIGSSSINITDDIIELINKNLNNG